HMNDHQLTAHNAVIDQIWKPHDRKNPNAGNIGLTAQAGMPREQLTSGLYPPNDCACGPPIMLRDIVVNPSDIAIGAARIPQPHRPPFFQSAAISSSVAKSPCSASARPSSTAARCSSGTTNRSLPAAAICSSTSAT